MINVIPYPSNVVVKAGTFVMPKEVIVSVGDVSWHDIIVGVLAKKNNVFNGDANATIVVTENKDLNYEGYTLDISNDRFLISASSSAGVLYAMTTLRQLIGLDLDEPKQCQCLSIVDAPNYE